MSETRIPVGGDQPYEVVVGTGVLGALPDLVGKRAETVAVFWDERLSELADQVVHVLSDAGYRPVNRRRQRDVAPEPGDCS